MSSGSCWLSDPNPYDFQTGVNPCSSLERNVLIRDLFSEKPRYFAFLSAVGINSLIGGIDDVSTVLSIVTKEMRKRQSGFGTQKNLGNNVKK